MVVFLLLSNSIRSNPAAAEDFSQPLHMPDASKPCLPLPAYSSVLCPPLHMLAEFSASQDRWNQTFPFNYRQLHSGRLAE